jgi:membrane protein YqaA with SNARE-associated domain
MGSIVRTLRALALTVGAPGLLLVAFADSSFLSLPEVVDLLVVGMVVRRQSLMVLYVASATFGSLAGCLVLYYLGRKGGEALARKHFSTAKVDRAMMTIRRHGMMAVLVPSMLPPPMPLKIFLLLAGGAGISATRFSIAILIGRTIRYLILGLLAVEYGDRAMTYLMEHGTEASLVVVGVLSAGFAAYLVWTKGRAASRR